MMPLGFVRFTRKPLRKTSREFLPRGASARASKRCGSERQVTRPSQTRYATPPHFTAEKRASEASRIAPSPTETTIISAKLATCIPTAFHMPRRKPWFSPAARLENTPGPGETDRTMVATR